MWSLADDPALRSPRDGEGAPRPPAEVWENQRFYGFAWQAPGPLERPAWSDGAGDPVPLLAPPAEGAGWAVADDDDADADGWSYASVFHHVAHPRRGGRASQRIGDFVRRRRWVWVGGGAGGDRDGTLTPAVALPPSRPDAAARKAAETARRVAALRAFVALLAATARRLRLWNLVPLDPTALVVLAPRHAARLAADAKLFGGARVDMTGAAEEEGDGGEGGARPLPPLRAADLMTAALHSRAAYGYAAAAGHLASLSSYAMMHTVRAVEFDAAGGASAAANSAAACDLAGVARGALLMAEWASSVSRPCHYVAADEAGKRIVVSIRGSLQVGDMLSNLSAVPMEVTLCGVSGRVHEGMMAAATYVHCSTAPALATAAERYPGWPILCVGHSMGGGVATILTALLLDGGGVPGLGPVSAVAVGPAAVFSEPLAAMLEPAVTSVVLGADAVPRLSLASVEDALVELATASPVRAAAAELRRAAGTVAGGVAEALAAAGAELRDIVSAVAAAGAPPAPAASPPAGLASLPRLDASDGDGAAAAAAAAMVAAAATEAGGGALLSAGEAAGEGARDEADADADADVAPPAPSPAEAAAIAARSAALMAGGGGGGGGHVGAGAARAATAATTAAAAHDAALLTTRPPPAASPEAAAADAVAADRTEPLLVGGRLLWVLPPGDLAAAAGGAPSPDVAAAAADGAARAPIAPDGDLHAAAGASGRVPGRVRRAGGGGADARAPPPPSPPRPPPHTGSLVLAAPRAAFGRILLTPDAVTDHLPDSYVSALEQL